MAFWLSFSGGELAAFTLIESSVTPSGVIIANYNRDGKVNYTAADNSNERASTIFQAVSNGKSFSFGNSIFDENATGKLKILSNLVGVYKTRDNANGTGTFVMWEWK